MAFLSKIHDSGQRAYIFLCPKTICFYLQDFQPPKKPFRRMAYTDAIKYLKEHDIKKDDGSYYEFGDVSGSK